MKGALDFREHWQSFWGSLQCVTLFYCRKDRHKVRGSDSEPQSEFQPRTPSLLVSLFHLAQELHSNGQMTKIDSSQVWTMMTTKYVFKSSWFANQVLTKTKYIYNLKTLIEHLVFSKVYFFPGIIIYRQTMWAIFGINMSMKKWWKCLYFLLVNNRQTKTNRKISNNW